jgi:hypothetical protein
MMGAGPQYFAFRGKMATVPAQEHTAQKIVDCFKAWLPVVSQTLKARLQEKAREQEAAARKLLRRQREAEERRLRINRNLKV